MGRLKIFLGMAAGVGKTYAMLEAAQKLSLEGVDLVVGIVETHGREETARLLKGLKVLPKKIVSYKNLKVEELDLGTILEIKPALVIVDELAHSNAPNSRHPKRWQDVVEILENGIDVYTTLNVQHIESLKNIVEKITTIPIQETVPDSIIETADAIELIDLTPKDLLARLKEGKVYLGEQKEIAIENFFKEDRLTALREMALRFSARIVDHDLQERFSAAVLEKGWKVKECLLVAVSSSVYSQQLIRTAKRLAFHLDAPWIVLHVDDGRQLKKQEELVLEKNLSLARELGAEVMTILDTDIARGIERIVRLKNITQIIVGRTSRRTFFNPFRKFKLVDKLAKKLADIDIHVIRNEKLSKSELRSGPKGMYQLEDRKRWFSSSSSWNAYLLTLGVFCALSLMNEWLLPFFGAQFVGFIFFLGVIFLSLKLAKGPLIFATLLYAGLWNFFFIPPVSSFKITSNEDRILYVLYVLASLGIGMLINWLRNKNEFLEKREQSSSVLYQIVREIASAPTSKHIIELIKMRLESVLNGSIQIFTRDLNDVLDFTKTSLAHDEKEKGIALWVFNEGKIAGWSTDTLPTSKHLYVPIKGYKQMMGVIAFQSYDGRYPSFEEKNFVYTVCRQLGNFLEREYVEEKARKFEHEQHIEKVHQTILKLISQEFQEPFFAIQTIVQKLKKQELPELSQGVLQMNTLEKPVDELIKVFGNISAMADLSDGSISLNKEMHSLEELIDSCIKDLNEVLARHQVRTHIQINLPKVRIDFTLVRLLLFNLLINAVEYSPEGSLIEIEAKKLGDIIGLSVSDEGSGIPEDQLSVIFEKFYRIPGTSSKGLGLGLSVAKSIAEMHQGCIVAENRLRGGAKVTFFLPVENE